MAHRIDQTFLIVAADADVLAGSVLDTMPGNGFLVVYATDTLSTTFIEIDPANHPSPTGSGPQVVPESGSGDTAVNHPAIKAYQPHWETEVTSGEKVVIRISGGTIECAVWVRWIGR